MEISSTWKVPIEDLKEIIQVSDEEILITKKLFIFKTSDDSKFQLDLKFNNLKFQKIKILSSSKNVEVYIDEEYIGTCPTSKIQDNLFLVELNESKQCKKLSLKFLSLKNKKEIEILKVFIQSNLQEKEKSSSKDLLEQELSLLKEFEDIDPKIKKYIDYKFDQLLYKLKNNKF